MIVCIQSLVSMQSVVLGARLNMSGARVNSFLHHQITAQSFFAAFEATIPLALLLLMPPNLYVSRLASPSAWHRCRSNLHS